MFNLKLKTTVRCDQIAVYSFVLVINEIDPSEDERMSRITIENSVRMDQNSWMASLDIRISRKKKRKRYQLYSRGIVGRCIVAV